MNQQDRETILDNIKLLKNELSYEQLTELCLKQKGLYFDEMRSKIEKMYSKPDDRLEALLIKLSKRGPTAFKMLLEICTNHFPSAARILRHEDISIREKRIHGRKGPNPISSSPFDVPLDLKEYTDVLPNPTFFTEVKKSTNFPVTDMKCYKMRSRNRGIAFIVNIIHFDGNDDRNGASKDRDNLVALFRQMGFLVMYYEDITKEQFFQLLKQLVKDERLRAAECLVMTLMTHGRGEKGWETVEFRDSQTEAVETIFEMFSNTNCPNMLHKPKVFFLPYCRGKDNETASILAATGSQTQRDGQPNVGPEETHLPISTPISHFSDIKFCYATSIGFAAQRDPELGAWYIESLCSIFAEYAHNKHLDDLLKLIGERTRNKQSIFGHMQTPGNADRGFYKLLYFNPGLFE